MPLPSDSEQLDWPPEEWVDIYQKYQEHAAWYSGDPNSLADVYAKLPSTPKDSYSNAYSLWRTNFDRFWARSWQAPTRRAMYHVPVAGDIATTSADLLFADEPEFLVEEAQQQTALNGANAVQDRLNELVENDSIVQTLTEAAESCAAMGGVFLRVTWDKEVEPDHPMLTAVDATSAIPEFRWGRLLAVTFWDVVADDQHKIYRHLERHEPGLILHGLYEGSKQKLGRQLPLASLPATADLAEYVPTDSDDLTAVYVPNMRPNRHYRRNPGYCLGRSDYNGSEALMDALDETYTSWMRDMRLARARLIVPQEYFEAQGKGKGGLFNVDQEVFEALPMSIARDSSQMITPSQFAIRTAEHQQTGQAFIERIISAAGYSASTFGLAAPGETRMSITATEIVNRERRSAVTRKKKIGYWLRPLGDILEVLLEVDAAQFQQHAVFRPRVDFSDSFQDDSGEVARTVQMLRAAKAISDEETVRMIHPNWTTEEVLQEVMKLQQESAPPTKITGDVPQTPAQDRMLRPVRDMVPQGGNANGPEAPAR